MAPVPLQPHSCRHCQGLAIDIRRRSQPDREQGEEKNFAYFQCHISNILVAAMDNCGFCRWLLDEEWIHRSGLVDKVYAESNLPEDDIFRSVIDAVAEASIRINERLPPPNPRNTLRHFAEEHRSGVVIRSGLIREGTRLNQCVQPNAIVYSSKLRLVGVEN
jgi:hypothetical protein